MQFGYEPLAINPFEKRGGSSPLLRLECVYVNSALSKLCMTKVGLIISVLFSEQVVYTKLRLRVFAGVAQWQSS